MLPNPIKCVMITRVRLENWKSHARTDLSFLPGTNVIVGINGAGKSSVLEAIFFALFGEAPAGRKQTSGYVRRGTERARVEIHFHVGGDDYTIVRTLGKERYAEMRKNGRLLAAGKAGDVNSRVEEVLSMDKDFFRIAVYASQNDMAGILALQPKDRKVYFDRMLGLERLEEVRKNVVSLANVVKGVLRSEDVATLGVKIEARRAWLKEAEESIENLRRTIEEKKGEREELERRVEELSGERERIEKEREEVRRGLEAVRRAWAEVEALRRQVDEIEKRFGKPSPEDRERLERAEKELEEMQRALDRKRALEADIKNVRERIAEIEADLRERIDFTEEDLRRAEEEAGRAEEERKRAEKRRAEISAAIAEKRGKADALRRRLTEIEGEMGEIQKKIAALGELEVEEIEKALADIEKTVEDLTRNIAEADERARREEELWRALEKTDVCPLCFSPLSPDRAEELREEHRRRAEEERRRKEMAEKELKKARAEMERLKKALESAKIVMELAERLSKLEGERKEKEGELRKIEEDLSRLEEALAAAEKALREAEEWEQRARKALEEAQKLYQRALDQRKKEEKLRELKEKLRGLEAELEGISVREEDVERLRREVEALKERVRALSLLDRIQELEHLVSKRADVERRWEDLEKRFEQISRDLSEAEAKLRSIGETLDVLEKSLKEKEAAIEERKKELEELEGRLRRIQRLSDALRFLAVLERALKRAQAIVRDERVGAINRALKTVWKKLEPYGAFPDIELRPEEKDYVLLLRTAKGAWVEARTLSGGERALAALALRFALSAILARHIGWLLLDEPTHNLDRNATEALARLLRDLPEEGLFRQIILITHDETLKQAATGALYIFEREKGEGGATVVTTG